MGLLRLRWAPRFFVFDDEAYEFVKLPGVGNGARRVG